MRLFLCNSTGALLQVIWQTRAHTCMAVLLPAGLQQALRGRCCTFQNKKVIVCHQTHSRMLGGPPVATQLCIGWHCFTLPCSCNIKSNASLGTQNGTAAARSEAEAGTSGSNAAPAAPQAGQVTVSYWYRWVLFLTSSTFMALHCYTRVATMTETPDGVCGNAILTLILVLWLMIRLGKVSWCRCSTAAAQSAAPCQHHCG